MLAPRIKKNGKQTRKDKAGREKESREPQGMPQDRTSRDRRKSKSGAEEKSQQSNQGEDQGRNSSRRKRSRNRQRSRIRRSQGREERRRDDVRSITSRSRQEMRVDRGSRREDRAQQTEGVGDPRTAQGEGHTDHQQVMTTRGGALTDRQGRGVRSDDLDLEESTELNREWQAQEVSPRR